MDYKAKDWIEHPVHGLGRVSEDRGDRLDIEFIHSGAKTILKTAELKLASPPTPDFKFPHDKGKSRTPPFKVERPPRRPPLDFDHLVSCFTSRFADGFEGRDFHDAERGYKQKAAGVLKDKLGKDAFENLLPDGHYAEVCDIAKGVLQSTNLVFRIEKAKFVDGIENVANQERFAKALYDLLHGSGEMEQRFTKFCDLLGDGREQVADSHVLPIPSDRWQMDVHEAFDHETHGRLTQDRAELQGGTELAHVFKASGIG